MGVTKSFPIQQFLTTATLVDLRSEPRWCAWTLQPRENDRSAKPAKIARGEAQRYARSNDPKTWIKWHEAMQISALLPQPYGQGGIGVFLGNLGPTYHECVLVGVDLDSCFDGNGGLVPWAEAVLDTLGDVYCETSPSGQGVKAFFLLTQDDTVALRRVLEIPNWSRAWKQQGAHEGQKAAGVEVHTGNRWFAVTGEGATALGTLEAAQLATLVTILKQSFGDGTGWHGRGGTDVEVTVEMIRQIVLPEGYGELEGQPFKGLAELRAMKLLPRLRSAWESGAGDGVDQSRSAAAFQMIGELRKVGWEQADALAMLFKCEWFAAWFAEKGDWQGMRELARAWHRQVDKENKLPVALPDNSVGAAVVSEVGEAEETAGPDYTGGVLNLITEESLAQWLVDDHFHEIRYIKPRRDWFIYDGKCWVVDTQSKIEYFINRLCIRVAARSTTDRKAIPLIMSNHMARAVERLARSDPRVAMGLDQWDRDLWLLNVQNGTLDLRTGKLGPHDQRHLITKIAAVAFDGSGRHPHWSDFLRAVTDNDQELEHYLQRVAGYCLTGLTHEQAIFFLYGGGSNGKSTFLNALMNVLGVEHYAQTVSSELFVNRKFEHHTAELARLRGARLVVTGETEKDKYWAESKIKEVTGGTPISAQFMRRDWFTFIPEFKLVVAGNHKPRIDSVNDAIQRRMNLIPFLVSFIDRQDKDLEAKLRSELPQILAWMVRGCLEWQQHGLNAPSKVIEATKNYMHEEDRRLLWFEDCCVKVNVQVNTREMDLFASWTNWASRTGEPVGSSRALAEWLRNRNFESDKNHNNQRVWRGVMFNPANQRQLLDEKGKVLPFVIPKDENDPEKLL